MWKVSSPRSTTVFSTTSAGSRPCSSSAPSSSSATSSNQPPYGRTLAGGSAIGAARPPKPEVSPVPLAPNIPCRLPTTSTGISLRVAGTAAPFWVPLLSVIAAAPASR